MSLGPALGWTRARSAAAGLACLALLVSLPAAAQSAGDREAAATAFDRGTAAYIAHDYARAAQWFETAFGLAPSSAALVQAIRANNRAGNLLRAGTLALRVPAEYADDRAAVRLADEVLPQATAQYVRVDVTCAGTCTLELDGGIVSFTSFFVEPGVDHRVRASFETGDVEQTVNAAAGETRALSFEAPPRAVVAVDEGAGGSGGGGAAGASDGPPPPGSGGGISPAFFVTGLVLTAIAGGVLVGAGIYTLDGVPAYEADPTPERLADGQSRETLTNAMIGVTAGLAATTVLLAALTDWDGDPAATEAPPPDAGSDDAAPADPVVARPSSPRLAWSFGIAPDGAALSFRGSF